MVPIQNVLEPEITGEFLLGYEEVNNPEWFELHAGLDESGKGDLFGPVVTACVIADGDMVRKWIDGGIRDSKTITDSIIVKMHKLIIGTKGVVIKTAFTGMPKYNEEKYLRGKDQLGLDLDEFPREEHGLRAGARECVVCLDRIADRIALPCGHLCLCSRCSTEVLSRTGSCPVCRGSVRRVQPVFT